MAKKLENMTQNERLAYWAKQQEAERSARQVRIDNLDEAQMQAIKDVYKLASSITDDALYHGGVRCIPCDDFNQLEDKLNDLIRQFNIG